MESKQNSLYVFLFVVILIASTIYIDRMFPHEYTEEELNKKIEKISKDNFRRFWYKNEDNFLYHSDKYFSIHIMIHKSEPFAAKGTFIVTFSTNYPTDKSNFIATKTETVEYDSFDESKGISKYTKIEKPYDLYKTNITFKDGDNSLVKNVSISYGGIYDSKGIVFYKCSRSTMPQDKYDELLLFLYNAKNDNVVVEVKDEQGNLRQHQIYVKGLKEWVNSKKNIAYFVGYEN